MPIHFRTQIPDYFTLISKIKRNLVIKKKSIARYMPTVINTIIIKFEIIYFPSKNSLLITLDRKIGKNFIL